MKQIHGDKYGRHQTERKWWVGSQSWLYACGVTHREWRKGASSGSETGDEEDVEPPLFDPIPRDPRFLLPQFCDE